MIRSRLVLPGCILTLILSTCCAFAQQASPPPRQVAAVEVVDGAFRVSFSDGSLREREAVAGMVLIYAVGSNTIRIRVAGVRPDPDDTSGRRLLHDFRDAATGQPLCEAAPDGTQEGFLIAGRASADGTVHPAERGAFLIAYTAGAQGKCVRFGYAPWSGQQVADLDNSCIHMLRADYCGLGEATTRNGTPIDLYDDLGIQKSENREDQAFEAGWGPKGAVCVNRVRIKDTMSLESLIKSCPRLADVSGPRCDEKSARDAGARLFNRSRP